MNESVSQGRMKVCGESRPLWGIGEPRKYGGGWLGVERYGLAYSGASAISAVLPKLPLILECDRVEGVAAWAWA